MGSFQTRVRQFATVLLKESLDPGRAAAAVFLGIFVGILPIYGFQLLVAVSLAIFFKLNKPLTVAGTFVNNPLLQPVIIVCSVELGYLLRSGSFRPFHLSALSGPHVKEELLAWVMGSVALGLIVGGTGAAIAAVVVQLKAPANSGLRDRIRFVKQLFAPCDWADRSFVRWKLRLDRIFGLLAGCLPPKTWEQGRLWIWAAGTVWLSAWWLLLEEAGAWLGATWMRIASRLLARRSAQCSRT